MRSQFHRNSANTAITAIITISESGKEVGFLALNETKCTTNEVNKFAELQIDFSHLRCENLLISHRYMRVSIVKPYIGSSRYQKVVIMLSNTILTSKDFVVRTANVKSMNHDSERNIKFQLEWKRKSTRLTLLCYKVLVTFFVPVSISATNWKFF